MVQNLKILDLAMSKVEKVNIVNTLILPHLLVRDEFERDMYGSLSK
jgi:hypothetical protein